MRFVLLLLLLLCNSCNRGSEPGNRQYADVFKPLDGHWSGKFYIYRDTRGQRQKTGEVELQPELWRQAPYELQQVIDVEQHYTSVSPYLQTVLIRDTYTDSTGKKRTVESPAVNKVENGKLLCIVHKPEEKVVHTGIVAGLQAIIWQRHLENPLRKEHFYETVDNDRYTIVGWGYYGDDDIALRPQTFFYGNYARQNGKR